MLEKLQIYDVKDIDGRSLTGLLETGLTKQVKEIEVRTTEKDINLNNLQNNFSDFYDMSIITNGKIKVGR